MSDLHPEFLSDYQLYSLRLKGDLAPEVRRVLETEFRHRKWSQSQEKAMHDRWRRSEERPWNGRLPLWEYPLFLFYTWIGPGIWFWGLFIVFAKGSLCFHETRKWSYRWKVIYICLALWILAVCAIAWFGDWESSKWIPPNAAFAIN